MPVKHSHPDVTLYPRRKYSWLSLTLSKNQADTTLDLSTLRKHLKEEMAPYKIPSILKIVDSIDRNAMGKVNKKQIVKRYFSPKL